MFGEVKVITNHNMDQKQIDKMKLDYLNDKAKLLKEMRALLYPFFMFYGWRSLVEVIGTILLDYK